MEHCCFKGGDVGGHERRGARYWQGLCDEEEETGWMLCVDSSSPRSCSESLCFNVLSAFIHILFESTFGLCNASSPSKASNDAVELVVEQSISKPNIESSGSESESSPFPFAQDMRREETESKSMPGFEQRAPRVWLSLSGKGCPYSSYTKFSIGSAWAQGRGCEKVCLLLDGGEAKRGKPLPTLLNNMEAEVGLDGAQTCPLAFLSKELGVCGPHEDHVLVDSLLED